MKNNFKKLLLPIITMAMLMGTAGLKEIAYATYAETEATEYIAYGGQTENSIKTILKNQTTESVRMPNFTFLIPGFGCKESAWSNDLLFTPVSYTPNVNVCITGTETFSYNDQSLLAKIEKITDANIYVVQCEKINGTNNGNATYKYHLYYYEHIDGLDAYQPRRQVKNIQSVDPDGKHSVIVYHSNDSKQNLEEEFANFERIANRICYDYSVKHHYIPKINLIGHSQGGLIAQEYANNYPKNVYSINAIASPFFGSETGRFLQRVANYPLPLGPAFSILFDTFLGHDGFRNFQDKALSNSRRDTWNEVKKNSRTRAAAYGTASTLPFLAEDLLFAAMSTNIPLISSALFTASSSIIAALDTINSMYVTDFSAPDFTGLISYERFERDCTPVNTSVVKEILKAGLRPMIDGVLALIASGAYQALYQFPTTLLVATIATTIEKEIALDDIAKTLAKSIYCYQGKVCLFKDDLLVSLDSQMCTGYAGYSRFVKVFDHTYLGNSNLYATTKMPFVGHNMETMNKQITNSIIDRGSFATKQDIQEDIAANHQYPIAERTGHVDYYLDSDDFEYHNGHGHEWGEYHASIPVNGLTQNQLDTVWVTCYDNHTNAEFFCDVLSFYEDSIQIVLYVFPEDFDATGYIRVNYIYECESTLNYIDVSAPTKTNYYRGEPIDYSGLNVTAYYSDGSSRPLELDEYQVDASTENVGLQTVTVTCVEHFSEAGFPFSYECTDTYQIYVREPELESINLNYEECQTSFYRGDAFNHNGLQVFATYEDGWFEQVTDFYVDQSHVNMNQAGTYPVFVSYTDGNITKTASYQITVEDIILESITLSGEYQTVFEVGDDFNYDGLVVTANYDNGYSTVVTNYSVITRTVNMNQAGTYTVRVRYEEGDITKTATYQITVVYNGPSLTEISLSGNYKTEFALGEDFSYSGLVVTAHYSDGTSRVVTGYSVMAISYNAFRPGTYSVFVSYSDNGGFDMTSYTVTVQGMIMPAILESITLSGDYRTTFIRGQRFNADNLVVTANYTDGSSEVVTNYIVDATGVNTSLPGIYTVIVTYTERSLTVTAEYTVCVVGKFIRDFPEDPIIDFPIGKF